MYTYVHTHLRMFDCRGQKYVFMTKDTVFISVEFLLGDVASNKQPTSDEQQDHK